jgi:DNA helicase-4
VLAYNSKAKKELEDRLSAKTKFLPVIMTFHGLGNYILRAGNTKKILSPIATDNYKFNVKIRKIIVSNILNSEFAEVLQEYFQEFFYPLPNVFNFKTEGEYWDYLESYEVRTLNNEKVKSIEECIIANFLYINGIKYSYEKPYKFDTQTPEKSQYQPDFYLEDYDIYIEHFAIGRNYKTPPFIDNQKYTNSIKWKREIHEMYNTNLIETYSYEKYEGKLLSNLKQKLKKYNVTFQTIDLNSLFDKLNKSDYMDTFTELLGTFLNHFKSNQFKINTLKTKIDKLQNQDSKDNDYIAKDLIKRQKAFIKIFEPVFTKYENDLKTKNEIDFNDMIQIATKYLNLGLYDSKFKYILVDEFQDISQGRALLLKELLKKKHVRLCCVGDDWQSIYRFTGSDISIMQNFEKFFGATKRIDLDMTFRFDDQINDVATKFITKNSSQLTKDIHTVKHNETPSVLIYYADSNNDSVVNVLLEIENNLKSPDKNTVLILSRFNKLKQKPKEKDKKPFSDILKEYQTEFQSLKISFSSVHGSKGLGFDYVILIDINRGAFPLEKIDDPILGLVLPEKENYPNAEERRLFYVALTRAKEKVYLIPNNKPSTFITELESPEYNIGIYGSVDNPEKIQCPKCGTGLLVKSSTQKSFICSHTNYCDYIVPVCSKCHKGFAVLNPETNEMECYACKDKKQKCPECKDGFLVERNGKFGCFYGCSNYPKCKYTRNIRRLGFRNDKYKNFQNYK